MMQRVGAFGRLLSQKAARFAPPAAPVTPAPPPVDERVDARERRIAERLLEDEALRGDLDDATWQPVQDWLLARVHQLAASTAALEDDRADEALEDGTRALRDTVGTLVSALEAAGTAAAGGRLEPIHRDLRQPVIDQGVDPRVVHAALRDAGREASSPGMDGPAAATRLVEALAAGANGKGVK